MSYHNLQYDAMPWKADAQKGVHNAALLVSFPDLLFSLHDSNTFALP